jgi:hypothetical protein
MSWHVLAWEARQSWRDGDFPSRRDKPGLGRATTAGLGRQGTPGTCKARRDRARTGKAWPGRRGWADRARSGCPGSVMLDKAGPGVADEAGRGKEGLGQAQLGWAVGASRGLARQDGKRRGLADAASQGVTGFGATRQGRADKARRDKGDWVRRARLTWPVQA